MASKKEKRIGITLGLVIGLIKARSYLKKTNAPLKEQWRYIIIGGLAGGTIGYLSALLLGSPDNTVNYRLFKNKKLVYHGITYKDRLIKRSLEHRKNGLKLDKILKDKPKARLDAMILEKKRIKRHRPIYNIQHNTWS